MSPALERLPQPVYAALVPSPLYCLTTIPANDVFAMREFWMVTSLSRVGVDGGDCTFGTEASNTMPPVFFEPSQPVLKWMPGALFAVSPLIQFTSPVTSWTCTWSITKPLSCLPLSPVTWMPRRSFRCSPGVPVAGAWLVTSRLRMVQNCWLASRTASPTWPAPSMRGAGPAP